MAQGTESIKIIICIKIYYNLSIRVCTIYFWKPENPVFLALLLSLFIHKLFYYMNGPTYDMYDCIKYMLNVKTIVPEKRYEIDTVRVKVYIGSREKTCNVFISFTFPTASGILYTVIKIHTKISLNLKLKTITWL